VAPEWQRWRDLLGGPAEVSRFLQRAMSRLNAPLEESAGGAMLAHLHALPLALRERLAARGLEGTKRIVFEEPGPAGADVVVRSHPLPAIVSDYLLEGALHQGDSTILSLGRIGVWPTTAQTITTLVLLRLRFKLIVHGRREKLLLVEEAGALAFTGTQLGEYISGEEAFSLLESPASGNLAPAARDRFLAQARDRVESALHDDGPIAAYGRERAAALLQDHDRVRSALSQNGGVPRVTVEPVLPADVVGLFVLIPGGV
jgi:hypothetical protein